MQCFQLVRGLYDTEIQEKILAEATNKNLSLAEIVKLSEAIESGKKVAGSCPSQGGLTEYRRRKRKLPRAAINVVVNGMRKQIGDSSVCVGGQRQFAQLVAGGVTWQVHWPTGVLESLSREIIP